MPFRTSEPPAEEAGKVPEVEGLLDRAVELLVSPTLGNLRAVEDVLREAIVRMPEDVSGAVAKKVRLCERLLASAEGARPGVEPPAAAYSPYGEPLSRPAASHLHRLVLEA